MAKRLIWINGVIDSDLVVMVERKLEKLNNKSDAPIKVHINSHGGSTIAGLAIYDLLCNSRAKIHTTVIGVAGSSASIILLGGDKRRILANAAVFVHNNAVESDGGRLDHHKARVILEDLECVRKRLIGVYQKHLAVKRRKIVRWMDKEKTFFAEEALAVGFVHEIVKSQKGKRLRKKAAKQKRKR